MVNKIYAVIDTNVLVSAMFAKSNTSTPPRRILDYIIEGVITPLFNDEILKEYIDVLSRDKFPFKVEDVATVVAFIKHFGIDPGTKPIDSENFPDPKDVVFYEVALSKEGSFLVTGNTKHFPQVPIVVTPAQMVEMLK